MGLGLGTIIRLSGANWVVVWLGLELNLFSFLPFLADEKRQQGAERVCKYFMVQVIGSLIFLFGVAIWHGLRFLGLLVKAGRAPVHFWFPAVVSGVSWARGLVLITWQKLAPLGVATAYDFRFYGVIVALVGLNSLGGRGGG